MNQQEELARRYRQRLALYPRAYRREHEEEMLSVLLDGARPGREFPRVVESLDLISGALRMRLRLLQPYGGNIGSDALAAFSLLAPLLLLGPVLATLMLHLVHGPAAPDTALRARYPALALIRHARDLAAHGVNLAAEGQLAVAIAVVLRLRRLALAVIALVLALWIFDARYGFSPGGVFTYFFLTCYGLEAAALIASPGPRRGMQLLSWKSGAVLAAAAAALTVTWTVTIAACLRRRRRHVRGGGAAQWRSRRRTRHACRRGVPVLAAAGVTSWCCSRPCSARTFCPRPARRLRTRHDAGPRPRRAVCAARRCRQRHRRR